jgi:SAM-dependent methyltransferase
MSDSLYNGSQRKIFAAFLALVDDSEAQLAAILALSSWEEVRSILSIGGGEGLLDAALLKQATQANLWYLDPSVEQCAAYQRTMQKQNLLDRVQDIAQTTFQDYPTSQQFERILSLFSWFYIGTNERWLTKLLDFLTPGGTAVLLLPNSSSIETVFYRALSPNEGMTLTGDQFATAVKNLGGAAQIHTYTKWLSTDNLFEHGQLSTGSLAFAAFAAERPMNSFTPRELKRVSDLLKVNRKPQGVPLSWDLIFVKHGQPGS